MSKRLMKGAIGIAIAAVMMLSGCSSAADIAVTPPPVAASTVAVPDVVGMTGDVAVDALQAVGLDYDYSALVFIDSNWVVESTNPVAGTEVAIGFTVDLNVYKPEDVVDPGTEEAPYVPAPVVTTTGGLDAGYAWGFCEQYGASQFPYGYTLHYILGKLAETYDAATDTWYLKAESTVTNAYNAEASTNTECYITGSNDVPVITNFLVY